MADKIITLVCKKCGHETSGPNAKSVKETADRHDHQAGFGHESREIKEGK